VRSVAVQFPYKRICIVGGSGSGKTTLGRTLSEQLDLKQVELDALYHLENWSHDDWAAFRDRTTNALSVDRWVCDGNYLARAGHIQQADLVIWLNYPFRISFARVLRRTLTRLLNKEELWNGNRESWRMTFSKESIIWWVITTHHRRKRELPRLLDSLETKKLIFNHPRETNKWLESLA
jgi:adenylate kinase family enzyme